MFAEPPQTILPNVSVTVSEQGPFTHRAPIIPVYLPPPDVPQTEHPGCRDLNFSLMLDVFDWNF